MHFPKQKIGIQRTRLVTLPSDHSLILKTSLENLGKKMEYLKKDKMHSKVKHALSKTEDWNTEDRLGYTSTDHSPILLLNICY